MWISSFAAHGLHYSSPWSRQMGTWLVPKPQPLSRALLLYLPLEYWTWIVLLSTLLSFGLIVNGIARLLPVYSRYQYIHNCFLDVSCILMMNCLSRFPRQDPL